MTLVKAAAPERFSDLELNSRSPRCRPRAPEFDLTLTRAYEPDKTDDELLRMPSVLSGSPRHIADTLIERRDRCGISYFTVQDYHGSYFAHVIGALR